MEFSQPLQVASIWQYFHVDKQRPTHARAALWLQRELCRAGTRMNLGVHGQAGEGADSVPALARLLPWSGVLFDMNGRH